MQYCVLQCTFNCIYVMKLFSSIALCTTTGGPPITRISCLGKIRVVQISYNANLCILKNLTELDKSVLCEPAKVKFALCETIWNCAATL